MMFFSAKLSRIALALISVLLLAGCANSVRAAQTAEPTVEPAPTLAPTSTPLPSLTPSPAPTIVPTPTPTQAPTPTPPPPPEGDFTLTFPGEDTGEGAYISFQSDDVRIAVDKVSKGGVTYFAADIHIKNIDSLRTALGKNKFGGGRESMKSLMKKNNALLAISGDYYGARERGVVIRNGKLYRDTPLYDVCVLYRNGEMKTYSNDEWESMQYTEQGVYQAWGFGPMLLDEDGMPLTEFNGFDHERLNPRAALGYYSPGHYCFVLVDGRSAGYSKGMLLSELSVLFYELGCKRAYNLDGGATAVLAFDGKTINQPSSGGRTQYDIVYICEPEPEEAQEED